MNHEYRVRVLRRQCDSRTFQNLPHHKDASELKMHVDIVNDLAHLEPTNSLQEPFVHSSTSSSSSPWGAIPSFLVRLTNVVVLQRNTVSDFNISIVYCSTDLVFIGQDSRISHNRTLFRRGVSNPNTAWLAKLEPDCYRV